MAKNQISDGKTMDVTLLADTESGVPLTVGDKVVVALTSGKTGDVIACATCGVWALPKVTADAPEQGKKLYLTDAGELTVTATDNIEAGVAFEAAANGDDSAQLLLK